MDDLHTLALEVARRIVESGEDDPAAIELALALLAEVEKAPDPQRAMRADHRQ
jgi:3-hydroxy-3-methylglutaryl CoA synthase